MRAVSEDHGDPLTLVETLASDGDAKRAIPRTLFAAILIGELKTRAVAGLGRHVVEPLGVIHLQITPVVRVSVHDLDRTGVIQSEPPDRVEEREGLKTTRLEGAGWG